MTDGHGLTLPAKTFLLCALKAGSPVRELAERMALSESTIYRFRDQFIPEEPLGFCIDPTMESFGIDEIKIGGGTKSVSTHADCSKNHFIRCSSA
jgi:hypothetical protein